MSINIFITIYVISNHILTLLQSGFLHGDLTTYQLLHTYNLFFEAVDNGKEVRAVFCDIRKAVDRVWHKGLLHKLRGIGCSEKYYGGLAAIFQTGEKSSSKWQSL